MSKGILKVGDPVNWKGAWGNEPTKKTEIESIEICKEGNKYGDNVDEVAWSLVKKGRQVVVNLTNGHWAYGDQLSEIE